MWCMFSEQANAIRLESVLERKIRLQSYWCGRTLIRAPTNNQRNACSFTCVANAEQVTFCNLFTFALVLHVLFAFEYRCGRALRFMFIYIKRQTDYKTCRVSSPCSCKQLCILYYAYTFNMDSKFDFSIGMSRYCFVQTATTRQIFNEIHFFGLIRQVMNQTSF